jgi:tetratricopeptide (TPR) repeat protein
VHNNLGILLARQHEYDAAIDSFQRALARDPGSEQAHYNIARAYEEKGERGEAALHYREAVALKPDFTEALRALERLGLEGAGNAE